MKEVLTKRFWQGVKKTFYEALEDLPSENKASAAPAPAEDRPKEAPPLGTSTSQPPASEHD